MTRTHQGTMPLTFRTGVIALAIPAVITGMALAGCSRGEKEEPVKASPTTTTAEYTPPAPPAPKTQIAVDGIYSVGPEIAPGIYVAPGGPDCHWKQVLEPVSEPGEGPDTGDGDEGAVNVGDGEGEQRVELAAGQTFQTSGCGQWNPAPPPPAPAPEPAPDETGGN